LLLQVTLSTVCVVLADVDKINVSLPLYLDFVRVGGCRSQAMETATVATWAVPAVIAVVVVLLVVLATFFIVRVFRRSHHHSSILQSI